MKRTTAPAPPSLAQLLTRRLTWIAVLVFILNSVAVGVYYGANSRALDAEVIRHQLERIETELVGTTLPLGAATRSLYSEHPEAYAYALVDRGGSVLDTMNAELIPPGVTDLYADEWLTRLDNATPPLLVGGQEFYHREDGLRAVFVMREDPENLLWRAYLREFYGHVWLPILPLIFLLIGTNIFLIRKGLAPISAAAAWARNLQPGHFVRPPALAVPAEIADLIDATERTIARLEEALAVETRRSAEIAHALRTPVAVLVARVDALPHGNQTAKLRADIAALARTVEQVLASARAEGMSEAHAEPMDLRSAAESVVSKLAPFAYDHGVELSLDAPADPVLALAIPEAVELAVLNLVENAVVHGGQSPVRVTVGPQACITVQDSGPGLPESWEARMFQPFWRGPQAVPGGSGLGLSIVSRLQRIQGGQVLARDVDPNGAEFELIWPSAS